MPLTTGFRKRPNIRWAAFLIAALALSGHAQDGFVEEGADASGPILFCTRYMADASAPAQEGLGSRFRKAGLQARAASSMEDARSQRCDLFVEVRDQGSVVEVFSTRSGRVIYRANVNAGWAGTWANLPKTIASAFQPGSRGYELVMEERASAAAAAASPTVTVKPEPEAAAPARPEPPRESDVDIPRYRASENPDDLALVVGVEKYSELPEARFAERDAEAVAKHFLALGVPRRNLVHLAGSKAGKAAIEKILDHWLPRMVKPTSRVIVYFSGHGAPDPKTGEAYLMPWDGDANYLEGTGYPLKRLYAALAGLKAKEVLVALDTCFSGAGGRSVLPSGARPLVTKVAVPVVDKRLTVLTASAANEISGSLDEERHGAFTYFLLKGLNGEADDLSASGLHSYLTPRVQDEARRLNREQTPQLQGEGRLRLR